MSRHHIRHALAFIAIPMIATGLMFAAEERVPAKPLRESARKILADPEFRHFEHFAEDAFRKSAADSDPVNGESTAPEEGRKPGEASKTNGSEGTASEAEPWWKNVLNKAQPKGSGKDEGTSRNQRLSSKQGDSSTPGSDRETTNGESEENGGSSTASSRGNRQGNGRSSNSGNSSDPSGKQSTTASDREKSDDSVNQNGTSSSSSGKGRKRTSSSPAGESTGEAQSSSGTGTDRSEGSSSQTDSDTESATGTPASNSQKPTRTSNETSKAGSTPKSPVTERPTRMQRPRSPSQRGSDGVQRPVRQSSRAAPTPKPSSPSNNSNWEGPSLGLGNLFGGLFHGLAYLILAVIVVAIVVLVAQALMQAWNDRQRTTHGVGQVIVGPLTHDRSPGETESDVFLREAIALAQSGDFRAAIGRLVMGGMSYIERQQWIRYRRGLTVHDYLRVLRSRPEQFAGFREVVHVFEPVEYGRRPATEPLFATALAGYQQGFQTDESHPVAS